MKIRSAVPENGCLIVLVVDGKKTKKHLQNIYAYTALPNSNSESAVIVSCAYEGVRFNLCTFSTM